MTATVAERRAKAGQTGESRNARLSENNRRKRAIPVTRAEADAVFAPYARSARASASRLARLNMLGLLRIADEAGEPVTQGAAHDATVDAMYPRIPE